MNNSNKKKIASVTVFSIILFLVVLKIGSEERRMHQVKLPISEQSTGSESLIMQLEPEPRSVNNSEKSTSFRGFPYQSSVVVDEETIEVKFDALFIDDDGFRPPENLNDVYDDLAHKALNKDIDAARNLALELVDCNHAHTSEAELNSAIERGRKDKIISFPDELNGAPWEIDVSQQSASEIEDQILDLRDSFDRCKDLASDKRSLDEIKKWATIAADQGDYRALVLMQSLSKSNPQEAIYWLNQSWERFGDVSALIGISMNHTIAVKDSESNGVRQDFKSSFAFHLAYSKLQEAVLVHDPDHAVLARFVEGGEYTSSRLGVHLSPAEHLEAVSMAEAIIRNNPNCCKSIEWAALGYKVTE